MPAGTSICVTQLVGRQAGPGCPLGSSGAVVLELAGMIHSLSCRQAGREQGWCAEFGTRAVVERKTGHSRTVVPAELLALNGKQPVGSSPPHTPVVPCPGRNITATATLSPPPRARASTASRCAHMTGCFTVSCTNATASSLLQGWRGVVGWLVRVGVGGGKQSRDRSVHQSLHHPARLTCPASS